MVAQKVNIVRKELLSTLEVEGIEQRVCPRVVASQAVPSEHVSEMQSVASQEVQEIATIGSRLEGLRDDIIKHLPMDDDLLQLPKLPKAIVVPDQLIAVNDVLGSLSAGSISDTNVLIYSAARVTLDRCGVRIITGQCVQQSGLPPWKKMLEYQIRKLRKKARVLGNIVVKDKTKKRALEVAKQRLMALKTRLQKYSNDTDAKRINQLFAAEPSRVYSCFGQLLKDEDHPELLTRGRTVLIMKDPSKGAVASSYRRIACLPTDFLPPNNVEALLRCPCSQDKTPHVRAHV